MQCDQTLDLRGLECPTPVMKAKKALENMEEGSLLKVVATDGMTAKNFATYAVRTGNEVVEHLEIRGEHHYLIKRGVSS